VAEFVRVTKTEEVPLGTMKGFEINFERIMICHNENGFYALSDECSHDSAPISAGELEDNMVVCPRHGAKFDLATGEVKAPPAVVGIDTFEIKIENDEIFVRLE
jgi:3-phenylpropionate/trans-cinnamate dioxygenase ferredoxin subunit